MKYLCILLVSASLALTGCGGGGKGSASNGGSGGSIEGRVVNSEDTPLPGAIVSVGGTSTTTDNHGQFTLQNVAVGTQVVSASLAGYYNDGRGSASVTVVTGQVAYPAHDLVLVATLNGEVYLRSLQASSSDFTGDPQQTLGGTVYFNSVAGEAWHWGWTTPDTLQAIYSLGRRYSQFKSQVGVSDTESDLNAEVIFKVIGDGTVLYQSKRLKVGIVETVNIDVSNVLTLQVQVVRVVPDPYSPPTPTVVWGDPRVTTK